MNEDTARSDLMNLFDKNKVGSFGDAFINKHLKDLLEKGAWSEIALSDAKRLSTNADKFKIIYEIDKIIRENCDTFSETAKKSLDSMDDEIVEQYSQDAEALAHYEVICNGFCPVTDEHRKQYKQEIDPHSLIDEGVLDVEKVDAFLKAAEDVGINSVSANILMNVLSVKAGAIKREDFIMQTEEGRRHLMREKKKASDAVEKSVRRAQLQSDYTDLSEEKLQELNK